MTTDTIQAKPTFSEGLRAIRRICNADGEGFISAPAPTADALQRNSTLNTKDPIRWVAILKLVKSGGKTINDMRVVSNSNRGKTCDMAKSLFTVGYLARVKMGQHFEYEITEAGCEYIIVHEAMIAKQAEDLK